MLYSMLEELTLVIVEPGFWLAIFVWNFVFMFAHLLGSSLFESLENLIACVITAGVYTLMKVVK